MSCAVDNKILLKFLQTVLENPQCRMSWAVMQISLFNTPLRPIANKKRTIQPENRY
jgi:hypothetical protein